MSQTLAKLNRIGLLEMANETTFVTTPGPYANLRTIGPIDTSGLKQESLEDMHARTAITQVARIPGVKKGTFTSKHYLHGFSTSLPVAAPTVVSHPLAAVFGWAFGQVFPIDPAVGGFASSVATTGSTTAHIDASVLTSFPIGSALAWNTQSYGYQVGWITNNVVGGPDPTFDVITLLQTARGVPYPVATATLYGSIVAAMTSGRDRFSAGVFEGVALRYTTHDGVEEYTMSGCMPTGLKISYALGQLATVEITWGVASWTMAANVTAPTAGAWAYAQPEPIASAACFFGSGATQYRLANLEFDLGLKVAEIPSPLYAGGVGGWIVEDRRPRCTFTVFRDPAASLEIDDWDDQTARSFVFTQGTQPGKMSSLCFPAARIVEYPEPGEENSARVSKVTIEAHNWTGDTGSGAVTDLIDKDCKFAWL